MFRRIALVLGLVLSTLVLGGFLIDPRFAIARSVTIDAAPAKIYAEISDLRTWPEWTAWTKAIDPTTVWTFSGSQSGAGARMEWRGEKGKLGTGAIELVAGDPATGVQYTMTVGEKAMQSTGALSMTQQGDATVVTWSNAGSYGSRPFGGWVGLLLGGAFESWFGHDLETGLANLKGRVEPPAPADPASPASTAPATPSKP